MKNQMVFKRYELKYLITSKQKQLILAAMDPYMKLDQFGRSTIRNIYFDTDTYRLIRNSLDKPVYKEKLRVRSYKKVESGEEVFVELKKKYNSIVYKRRMTLPQNIAMGCLCNRQSIPESSQISKEIDYFCSYYQTLRPVVFLSYERDAYYSCDGSDFRVTFDENIMFRQDRLSLTEEPSGEKLLDEGISLMEIKTSGGIPLWLTKCMSENEIRKTSFSKYGTAYRKLCESGRVNVAGIKKETSKVETGNDMELAI